MQFKFEDYSITIMAVTVEDNTILDAIKAVIEAYKATIPVDTACEGELF